MAEGQEEPQGVVVRKRVSNEIVDDDDPREAEVSEKVQKKLDKIDFPKETKMTSKIKRFSEFIIWNDREGSGYTWERAEKEVLKQFDIWRIKAKPRVISVDFGRCVENSSLDLEESPRYFFLRVLYDDGNAPKIKRAEEK